MDSHVRAHTTGRLTSTPEGKCSSFGTVQLVGNGRSNLERNDEALATASASSGRPSADRLGERGWLAGARSEPGADTSGASGAKEGPRHSVLREPHETATQQVAQAT